MTIDLQRYWGHYEIYHAGELTARIIESMQQHNQVVLVSKEIRSLEKSGLLDLLDELCDYHKWAQEKITIEIGDFTQSTDRGYQIKYIEASEAVFNIDVSRIEHRSWNRDRVYGMFIGRANVTRMYAAHRHLNFEYKFLGLTSFNQDISHYVDPRYLLQYLCETNQRWEDVASMRPWSDIDQVQNVPITGQFQGNLWNDVYEKIGIEIVLETTDTSDCWGLTEKLLRPIMYRRPFILVARRHCIKNILKKYNGIANIPGMHLMKNIDGSDLFLSGEGFKLRFFENVIPLDYDDDEGIHRVEHAFDILRTLIRTGKIQTILEDCAEDIEANYNVVKSYADKLKQLRSHYDSRYETNTWHLR